MKRIVTVGNRQIVYTLVIKKIKNVNLHIDQSGNILVSCNAYVPLEKVDAFVAQKMTWILEKVEQVMKRKQMLEDKHTFLYLGKPFPIHVIPFSTSYVRLTDECCIIYKKENDDEEKILGKFEKELARKLLSQKMKEVYEQMSLDYGLVMPTLKIRTMTSRWGSCIPKKNQITLNTLLIHYPERFIDYVVLHEYAHLIQPNHSKAFYAVIEKYMPDYKEVSKNLSKIVSNSR